MSNRETLKTYFRKGAVPTEEQFADLIDSTPNIEDDGFVKVQNEGGKEVLTLEHHSVEQKQTSEYFYAPADGDWHNVSLTTEMRINQLESTIYKFFAVYLLEGKRPIKMMDAKITYCSGGVPKLYSHQKHWYGWSGLIQLRWKEQVNDLFLQIRGKQSHGGLIGYQIIKIWEISS